MTESHPDAADTLAQARERVVDLGGVRIAVLEWGSEDGPPLLCLHGWLDNAASFAPLAPHLADLRLVAPDLPGHGLSDHRPSGSAYHTLEWVGDVVRLCDALDLRTFALMGHSMGAGIAALVAGTVPSRVARLVLLEGLGPRSAVPAEVPDRVVAWLDEEREARRFGDRRRPAAFETAVRARVVNRPIERRSAELLALRGTEAVDDGVLWRHDRALQRARPSALEEDTVRAFLRRIACPTLLVMAGDGERYLGDVAAERAACIADRREAVVPGNHHVHMDHPERVAEHVVPFLG
jgi:pimeloyl-ACP methyl ester carboxylesterase